MVSFVAHFFKERSLDLVQESSKRARLVGAVNAMRRKANGRWVGDIFDGVGPCRAVIPADVIGDVPSSRAAAGGVAIQARGTERSAQIAAATRLRGCRLCGPRDDERRRVNLFVDW